MHERWPSPPHLPLAPWKRHWRQEEKRRTARGYPQAHAVSKPGRVRVATGYDLESCSASPHHHHRWAILSSVYPLHRLLMLPGLGWATCDFVRKKPGAEKNGEPPLGICDPIVALASASDGGPSSRNTGGCGCLGWRDRWTVDGEFLVDEKLPFWGRRGLWIRMLRCTSRWWVNPN
jgi:hypothetical protein